MYDALTAGAMDKLMDKGVGRQVRACATLCPCPEARTRVSLPNTVPILGALCRRRRCVTFKLRARCQPLCPSHVRLTACCNRCARMRRMRRAACIPFQQRGYGTVGSRRSHTGLRGALKAGREDAGARESARESEDSDTPTYRFHETRLRTRHARCRTPPECGVAILPSYTLIAYGLGEPDQLFWSRSRVLLARDRQLCM